MSIKFKAKTIDIVNIIISKGGNFILTFLVFSLVSTKLNSKGFADFGYWWGVGLMVGGVAFAGLSSTLVRDVAKSGFITHKKELIKYLVLFIMLTAFIGGNVALWGDLIVTPINRNMLLSIFLFGIFLQLQILVISILRTIEATTKNLIASTSLTIIIPSTFLLLNHDYELEHVFNNLAVSYGIGFLLIVFISKRELVLLFTSSPKKNEINNFNSNVISFTALNFFSYSILLIDVSIFKYMGGESDYTTVATVKIYLERFLLPLMLIFTGGVSLMVMRYNNCKKLAKLELRINFKILIMIISVICFILVGYSIYNTIISNNNILSVKLVIVLVLGYLLYILNGVILDVLVIRNHSKTVVKYIVLVLFSYTILQFLIIPLYGVTGWSTTWLAFNLVLFVAFVKSGYVALNISSLIYLKEKIMGCFK